MTYQSSRHPTTPAVDPDDRPTAQTDPSAEEPSEQEGTRLKLHCQVKRVGPSELHPDLAEVELSVPLPESGASARRPDPHSLIDLVSRAGSKTIGTKEATGARDQLVALLEWLIEAHGHGLVNVTDPRH
ncbi:hypothetical protein HCC61_23725 [Streptomyces sp. HNM0575]|uniref:hypothetical protein n=1 Tax=Streptomyces sp. HNM0575 TaxID=2716338 RepID=UPI00145FCEEB|nr:hypothetical protein [Streptomyces sp. HNM0575]NLU75630.1 hypothetical protein [Streptomyces sp. HNM0575]